MSADPVNSSDEHRMVPGSHERTNGPECVCGAAWDWWYESCARLDVAETVEFVNSGADEVEW